MRLFRALQDRYRFEVAVVVVPLLAILALQYVSSRRLAEVEVIASQTTVARYLDEVTAEVRHVYQDAAQEMLDVPGDVLAGKQFEEIARHFARTDTSTARFLFAGALDGCLCLTRYYHPSTGAVEIGAAPEIEAVILRASTLLRAGTLLSADERLRLDRSTLYVDEADPGNRAVFRFVSGSDSTIIGFVGFVVDTARFEREYLPGVIADAMDLLPRDVHDNLIVRATDDTGRVVTATHAEPGQDDLLAARFDFLFRDWELSARSRYTAAGPVLASNAFRSWVLTLLMSVAVLGGVLLTLRAAGRERRLSRIRNAFVANASHELRTPLASISVFGEFLRRGRVTSSEKVAEYGRHIELEAGRLQHLIDNVLNFARIESAAAKYSREDAAVEDVVEAAVQAVDAWRERDGFTIAVTRPEDPLPVVRVDAQAMTQVFVNLLDNAMKYSGPSRRVRVDLSRRGGCVAVGVSDSGIGIAPDDQERIFQQFYRAAAAVDNKVNGTGLGLAIARHVVQGHGGSIEVDSRPGRGATFDVLIPACVTPLETESGSHSAAVERAGLRAGAEA